MYVLELIMTAGVVQSQLTWLNHQAAAQATMSHMVDLITSTLHATNSALHELRILSVDDEGHTDKKHSIIMGIDVS